jgi:hypothetical protein
MNSTLTQFSRRKGATLGAVIATALGSVLLLCGAGLTPTGNVQTSDVNANGHSITNAATVSATDFVGNGAGITNVPSSSITGLASNYVSTASLTTTLGSYQTALSGTMTATGTSTAQVWMQALDSGYSTFVPVRMSGQNLLCYPTVTGDFNYTVANNTVFTHAASIDCSTITTLRGLDTGTGSPGDSTITVTSTFTHSFPNLAVIQGGSNDGSGNSDGSDTSGYFATYAGNAILKYTGISSAPSIGVQSLTAGADPGSELDYSNLGGYAGNAEFLVTACTSFTYLDLHTV